MTLPAPPWGEDFTSETAWSQIQTLRADKERLAAIRALTDAESQQLDEYNRLIEASKSDLDRANDERARYQQQADEWRTSSVASRIEVLAAADFADPSDAVGQLDAAHYIDGGGTVNEAAIKRDLAAMLEQKPHWRRPGAAAVPRMPAPNAHQGIAYANPVSSPRDTFGAVMLGLINGSPL